MDTKQCSRCKKEKPLSNFYKDSRYSKGVKGECKECLNEKKSTRYYANLEEERRKHNEWQRRRPDLREKRRIRSSINLLEYYGYTIISPKKVSAEGRNEAAPSDQKND